MPNFCDIKKRISARSAGELYGLHPNRHGMVCCPFHPDKTPSMKLDERFHCFGCGVDGDAIDLTAGLFQISLVDAAKKLSEDFGLVCGADHHEPISSQDTEHTAERHAAMQRAAEINLLKQFKTWKSHAMSVLLKYLWLLRSWKEEYAPRGPTEEWHPLFCEALRQECLIEYYLELLLSGTQQEQVCFFGRNEGR